MPMDILVFEFEIYGFIEVEGEAQKRRSAARLMDLLFERDEQTVTYL